MNTDREFEKFESEHIGPKIISYMAEGLYPNACDPIREYVQNAVDAGATDVALHISNDSIIIENNGEGMDSSDMWRLLRIAISDKDPEKDVGYKGIGIYSGLFISQKLIINSKKHGGCAKLLVDFKHMRNLINEANNIPDVINESASVEFVENFKFHDETMGGDGTQVILQGIREHLRESYKRKELSTYLTKTMPLSFDSQKFCYTNKVNAEIDQICKATGSVYRSVPIHLTIDGCRETLFSPYQIDRGTALEPQFEIISLPIDGKDTTFALVWGCLNKERRVFPKRLHRGFTMKQKGFTIGNAETVQPYFQSGGKFANRYIGEIVILSHHLKANTARSDLAHTQYLPEFKKRLKKIAEKYEKVANTYQENSIALEECDKIESQLSDVEKSPTREDISDLRDKATKLRNRLNKPLEQDSKSRIDEILEKLNRELITLEIEVEKKEKEHQGSASSGETESSDDQEGDDSAGGRTGTGTSNRGIPENAEVKKILDRLNEDGRNSHASARKIGQLYNSLCTISIEQHPCLGYIGTWALWETLGFALKNNQNQKAWDYLTQTLSNNYKSSKPNQYRDMSRALRRILEDGNMNKHSSIGVGEDGSALKNNMEILDEFLLDLIEQLYEHLTNAPWKNNAPSDNS